MIRLELAHPWWRGGQPTVAGIQVVVAGGRPVVVVTELGDNPGVSITNAAEAVFDAVRRIYPDAAVVEHYDADSYAPWGAVHKSRVQTADGVHERRLRGRETFDHVTLGEEGQAQWRHLADNLPDALEAL